MRFLSAGQGATTGNGAIPERDAVVSTVEAFPPLPILALQGPSYGAPHSQIGVNSAAMCHKKCAFRPTKLAAIAAPSIHELLCSKNSQKITLITNSSASFPYR
jgi:hypothetical protein